ncbi:DNA primase [Gloeocapsa sp. PCC 73106]|uniref:DNA primase n=1 Tax=Gloeocapsa sp. PCC 73106 TaxID=102232 RepID=UPI0002ABF961|nr:DNA primase [Gloeocapsa sp. PCC 73106]ELS00083.1 DNA primase, catalytic core [Gloeocapsa sp. PCC 73106]
MDIPRLHPETIASVKERVDLLEIVSDYVVLRKKGKNHLGLCPFHAENTPSFTVSTDKQLYHCFGCGAGGNALGFLMELEKRSFTEVVLELAQRYQVPVKTLQPEQRQALEQQLSLKEQLGEILAVAASFYQHTLYQPQGEVALAYLRSQRELTEATIQQFQLGYAPEGWETLYRYLVEVKRFPVALVETAGLLQLRQSGGYYDRFRDRVMIPILDTQGRVIAFGSRTLTDSEPKYLNSPETPLFNKSQTLFALSQAYRSISAQDQVIVVEGYFDAIALHQRGIDNVVACLGTALTSDHLKKVLRYTASKRVILNFDTDSAGTQATDRVIENIASLIYAGQVQLRVLHLPEGKDADEFLKTGDDAVAMYRQALLTAPLWLDWQLEQLVTGRDLKQGDQFQEIAAKMLKLLAKLTNFDLQAYYLGYCGELLSQGNSQLGSMYAERLLNQLKKPQTGQKPALSTERSTLEEAELTLLRIYLHQSEHRFLINQSLEAKELAFVLPEHRDFWLEIVELEQQALAPSDLSNSLRDYYLQQGEIPLGIQKLFMVDEKTLWEDQQRAPLEIEAAIARLEQVNLAKYCSYCLAKWLKLDPLTQKEEMNQHYQELEKAKRKLQALE